MLFLCTGGHAELVGRLADCIGLFVRFLQLKLLGDHFQLPRTVREHALALVLRMLLLSARIGVASMLRSTLTRVGSTVALRVAELASVAPTG